MIAVMLLMRGDSFRVLGRPIPMDLGDGFAGFLPVFETLADAQKEWPDAEYLTIEIPSEVEVASDG